jgi:hypothetical protein
MHNLNIRQNVDFHYVNKKPRFIDYNIWPWTRAKVKLLSGHILLVPTLFVFGLTNWLHGPESSLRSQQLWSHSRNALNYMTPEGSLPCSQEPIIALCHDPDESSPHSPSYFFKIHFNIILPSTANFPIKSLHTIVVFHMNVIYNGGPTLWSSGQSFWLRIQRSRVRFPTLPDFLRSSGYGTGSTQPREDNWGDTWRKK